MLTVGIIFGFKANPVIAEVLTVHFEKRTMRVRWVDPDDNQKHTWDTSAEPFFAKYSVVPNTLDVAIEKLAETALAPFENFMNSKPNPDCSCAECNPMAWWMILCSTCGNKRCPHATHHDHTCTGSNEPGQVGSSWENCKPLGPATA
jgi:hypothetical protein